MFSLTTHVYYFYIHNKDEYEWKRKYCNLNSNVAKKGMNKYFRGPTNHGLCHSLTIFWDQSSRPPLIFQRGLKGDTDL